jgi:hypothetical protein
LALSAALAITTAAGCSSPPTARPPVATAPVSLTPKVLDIVGARELKPLQESALVCATTNDSGSGFTYVWSAEKGTINGDGRQVKWVAPDSQGDWAITVTVSNEKGDKDTFTKKFKVTDNPFNSNTVDSTIYLQLSMQPGNKVTATSRPKIWTTSEIQCNVQSDDPSSLSYQWTAPTGKLAGNGLNEGKASRVGWIAPGVAGQYSVSVAVTDKSGNVAHGEVNFDVYCCKP